MRGWGLTLILPWCLLAGCATSPMPPPSGQFFAAMQSEVKKKELQEQLLKQASSATLTAYKDYEVGPEDLLEVSFFGQEELCREIRVNGQGEISLPLVGVVPVSGLSPQGIESRLVTLYKEGRLIRSPQITVFVKEYRHQRVAVTGAVAQPGAYEMIGPRTLLEMLGKAGGLSEKAGEKAGDVVHIIRHQSASARTQALKGAQAPSPVPASETMVIDLRRLLMEGSSGLNIPIKNGDIIHVPYAQSAYVLGAVKKPGQVLIKENLTVTQALALTEGLDPMLASSRISILRFDDRGERLIIPVNLDGVTSGSDLDPPLKGNDIVFVAESGYKRFLYNFKNLMPGAFSFGYSFIP